MRSVDSIISRLLPAAAALFILFSQPYASDETIGPESWIYDAMRTFELAGLVELEPRMPWSRKEVESYLDRILERTKSGAVKLTPRQEFLLERLREEFQGKGSRPSEREDRPLIVMREGERTVSFDLAAGASLSKEPDRERGEVRGTAVPEAIVDLGRYGTVVSSYRLTLRREEDLNRPGEKPSYRSRSFRGLTSEYERAYIVFGRSRWKVLVGRDYVHWGSGTKESLILSRTAGSLDHLSASLDFGRYTLSTIQAVLGQELPRRLAGHRLEIRLPHGIRAGMSETALYTGRDVDFSYLIPLSSYYANQYNENGDDNILWSLDLKVPVRKGLILYGEFLIDDFQYEERDGAPDRLGFNATAEMMFTAGSREIELMASYTYLDIYTYAHKDSLVTRYVTGDGDPSMCGLLGSPLGPDSDRWMLELSVPVHPRVLMTLGGSVTRHGEGNDLREWEEGVDPRPEFPLGDVLTLRMLRLEGRIDMGRGSFVSAGWGVVGSSLRGENEKNHFAYLDIILDF